MDGVDHVLVLAVLLRKIGADRHMRSLDLVINRLAHIVQQTAALCEHHVSADLRCHDAGEMSDLDRVVEHVLSVARAIAQTSEELHKLGMKPVYARFKRRLLARFLDALVNLALRLLDHLLDARRMDAPIRHELLQCDASHFAAHRVETRKDDSLGRIVDDKVDSCQRLKRADVAPLASDDATFHLIVRQRDHRNRRLRHLIGSTALDGERDDVARTLVRLILRLLLVILDHQSLLVLELFFRLR